MEEVAGNEKRLERYGSKPGISILAENSYKFITECFSPFTPFVNSKIKSCKPNQSQSSKQFERCEYKISCRPPIQLFKYYHDDKIKKTEENPAQPQKKLMKINKLVNKIFQHNPTDSESLKMYRNLYIYKRCTTNICYELSVAPGADVSVYTISRQLAEINLHSKIPVTGPLLTASH